MLGLLLLGWAYERAGGFGPMLTQPSAFRSGQPKPGSSGSSSSRALTGMVGFWATLSLNIPDFSRYANSQRDQMIGQAFGLPATMALYSLHRRRRHQRDHRHLRPRHLGSGRRAHEMPSKFALVIAMLAICIATLATNIAANVVCPANDFANLSPREISFRTGG